MEQLPFDSIVDTTPPTLHRDFFSGILRCTSNRSQPCLTKTVRSRDVEVGTLPIPGLPSVPTDNYHKFKAIAGIWLIAGSVAAWAFMLSEFDREYFDLQLLIQATTADLNELSHGLGTTTKQVAEQKKDIQHLASLRLALSKSSENIDRYIRRIESLPAPQVTKAQLEEANQLVVAIQAETAAFKSRLDALSARIEATSKVFDNERTAGAAIAKEAGKLSVLHGRFKAIGRNFIIVTVAGLGLIVWGVWLARTGLQRWRYIQEIQDEHLLRQLGQRSPDLRPAGPPDTSAK